MVRIEEVKGDEKAEKVLYCGRGDRGKGGRGLDGTMGQINQKPR